MEIKVGSDGVGQCHIKTDASIEKRQEYLIKGLACLQLMCMNHAQEPDKFDAFENILKDTTRKITDLFEANEELNGTEYF